ncbi:anti-RNA polymerase sigma 70 factor ['Osedax' symbiont bacterium Rs2_46_30_T18]|nr:anti-RNA polymerase sigma 70 factor ['Osedax' symbiont bacterium Rs2_46_30_T18]
MLEKCKGAQERWGGVSEIIDAWLDGRQVLISHFVSLPSQSITHGLNEHLNLFCGLLMDYLSSGHFEIYEQLLREGSDFDDGSLEEAQKLFPMIQSSTDRALDFNDKFSSMSDPCVQEIREFAEQLSQLGEALENRFTLEDRMIELLHSTHSEAMVAKG